MTDTAAASRTCYAVDFRSAVHGGQVTELVYATSPAHALAQFKQNGPAVEILAVRGAGLTEYPVVNGDLVDNENDDETAAPVEITRRPRRFATRSRVVVVADGHPHFAKIATVTIDEGGARVDVRFDGATFSTVVARSALVATTR